MLSTSPTVIRHPPAFIGRRSRTRLPWTALSVTSPMRYGGYGGPADEFREQAIDLARIVRTVSVRQDLLTTWGFAVRRR